MSDNEAMEYSYNPPANGYGNCVVNSANENPKRIGDWMQGFKGEQFWPFDPHPEDIQVETIAHALSLQCRFGGHTKYHYSVAQHSVLASHFQPRWDPLAKLMHDASEAFLQDVPRPIKRALGMEAYNNAEVKWHRVLATKFHYDYPFSDYVKLADEVMLHTEAAELLTHGKWHEKIDWDFLKQFAPLPQIDEMTPREAEQHWLTRFHDLTKMKRTK